MSETLAAFSLILHLAGAAPYSGGAHASEADCRRAGLGWLARVRHRSPNDHYECVRVR